MTARRILTLALLLALVSASAWGALTITNTAPPNGTIGQLYNSNTGFQFTSSPSGATWTTTTSSGTLPPGLTLSTGGLLSGQLTQAGQFGFVVTATLGQDVQSNEYVIIVSSAALSVDQSTFNPRGAVGVAYSNQLGGSGGIPPYTFFLAGNNNDGITISPSGVLSGTPTSGVVDVPLSVGISDSSSASSAVLHLNVIGIDTTTLPAGSIGVSYSSALQASGGFSPLSWTLTASTTLPPGLTLSSDGIITGVPTTNGSFPFTVKVVNSLPNTTTKSLTLVIGSTLSITTTSLSNATVGSNYSQTLAATGGTAPLTWSATGLPATLTLSASGVLTGAPAATGSIPIAITVTDATHATATATLTLVVVAPPFSITTASPLTPGTVGISYTQALQASGGVAPLGWTATGLPAGLAIDPVSGTISGTPTASGSTTFLVTATDSNNTIARASLTLAVAVSTLTISDIPAGCFVATAGRPYPDPGGAATAQNCPVSPQFTASGGTAPYTWTATGLPTGMTLSASTGILGGTPAQAGTFNFTVVATDSQRQQGSLATSIQVVALRQLTSADIILGGNIGPTIAPAQQPAVVLSIGGTPFRFTVFGTLTLSYVSSVGGDDQLVRFLPNGTRTAKFSIPPNTSRANFNDGALAVATGTVAGTITVTATFTDDFGNPITLPSGGSAVYTINPGTPVITKVVFTSNQTCSPPACFLVSVTGYSTPRDMSSALFTFTPTTGTVLGGADQTGAAAITVPLGPAFTNWYGTSAANAFGSLFTFTVPFTFSSSGVISPAPISALKVSLTNSKGTSSTFGPVNP